tara:strand:- start:3223 stop:4062 length:840 start_codon:yes stop_codon:yes gene_type:complete
MVNIHNGHVFYTDISHYYKFLHVFGEQHTFQTFDDKNKNKKLIRQLHGTIKEHFHELAELNRQGAGVFFTVNQTDLCGRSTKHIEKIRAVFIDLDGTPLPEKFQLNPHFIINTSPNKYHCYWLVKDMPLKSFNLYQKALAIKFKSDPVIYDLPRLLRVPGFFHKKRKSYPVKIVSQIDREPYSMNQIKITLKLERPKEEIINVTNYESKYSGSKFTTITAKGDRHEKLIRMLIGIRLRGESYEYAKGEAIVFNQNCQPPEQLSEIMFQLNDIWRRYAPT